MNRGEEDFIGDSLHRIDDIGLYFRGKPTIIPEPKGVEERMDILSRLD